MADERRVHRFYRLHRILDFAANVRIGGLVALLRVTSVASLSVIAVFLTLIRFTDPAGQDKLWPWVAELLGTIHKNRFLIVVALVVTQIVCQSLLAVAKFWQRTNVRKLEAVLDALVTQIFPDQDRSKHCYRATLFRARGCVCCGSWLGIVARSGKRYPQKTTVFSINAKTRKHCTGIAGECWRQLGQTIIRTLPNLRESNPTPENVVKYKVDGCLDDREYEIMNVKAVVLLATGIRIAGELWGVLAIDCTDEGALPRQKNKHADALSFAAVSIEQLIR